jgi:transposase
MQVMYEKCAGMDVHKDSVYVCVVKSAEGGVSKEVRTFGTTTRELLRLREWLEAEGVTHAAMESTGVYWKPVLNILDGAVEIWLANATEVKNLPGRKTDVKDCEWLGDLMRHGLIRRSFVLDGATYELRELTRYRTQVVRERASEVNRIQKMLEGANIKMGSVLADVMGKSGRAILNAIARGETNPGKLADLAVDRVLKTKRADLELALDGKLHDHHRFMLKMLLKRIDDMDKVLGEIDQEVERRLRPFEETIRRLDGIPGIARRAAEVVLAEIGTDMTRFKTSAHLASWAGLCPGNNKSAGKRYGGKTRKGSKWLRSVLIEAARASSRKKNSYFQAKYGRLKGRRGPKKACVAQAHALLVVIYNLLKRGSEYKDLGATYLDELAREKIVDRLTRRLHKLGYEVTPVPDRKTG